ncbi:DHHA1 domain-containing protein [Candidatus Undinarchaeota archaeon]
MDRFKRAIERVKKEDFVEIVGHIDADGISAAAILSTALERAGIEHKVNFLKQMRESPGEGFYIISDMGSGQLDILESTKGIILDHHKPMELSPSELIHINAHQLGFNGSTEISGAGMAYLFAKELDKENINLSQLAVIGAVGDVQNFWGKFEGQNKKILKDAVNEKLIKVENDLMIYGRQTRPLFMALQYFTDPYIPGVSNSQTGSHMLLKDLEIEQKHEGEWRRIADLTKEEKQKLGTELIKRSIYHAPERLKKYVGNLVVGETYQLASEKPKTQLRDVDEYTTCLNACGRNGKPEIGLKVCKGDRKKNYSEMLGLLKRHRRNLAKGMEFIEGGGIKNKEKIQYFDARGKIKETIVGTIAGMLLGSESADPYKPMIGISSSDDDMLKLSGRCSRLLVLDGLDLGDKFRAAAKSVGGVGGGHTVACGAFVPEDSLEEFIKKLDILC